MTYNGSAEKVPPEYWEYRLVEQHFRGNWFNYWRMPEPMIEMIIGFIGVENEASELQTKRLKRKHGR